MSTNSKIEWTEHTANLWHGCTKVHAGCDHCYAETLSHRWGRNIWGPDTSRMMIKSVWNDLKKQQAAAAVAGEMHRVFVGSMMDIFEKPMILVDSKGEMVTDGVHDYPADTGQLRDQLFEEISEGKYPNLFFLFLTKRPSNINKMIPGEWLGNTPTNIMYGTSPCDQKTFDNLWSHLARVAGKRFLSIEPLLGPVVLKSYCPSCNGLLQGSLSPNCGTCHSATIKPDWVIVGGESGHGARPMHPDWVRKIRDQCQQWNIPFFFKQWGNWFPFEETAQPPFWRSCANGEEFDSHGMNMIDPETSEAGRWHGHQWYDTMAAIQMSIDAGGQQVNFLNMSKKEAGRFLDGEIYNELPKFLQSQRIANL
jgi:protein gp37